MSDPSVTAATGSDEGFDDDEVAAGDDTGDEAGGGFDDEAGDDEGYDDDDQDEDEPDGNRITGGLSRSVLEYLARSIVDDPDSVVVEVDERRRGLTLRLHVAPSDMGRIIGRRGRVAQAIRTVVRAAGVREGVEATVDIAD